MVVAAGGVGVGGEPGAVVAVFVVFLRGCGGLGGVSVVRDEVRVVRFVVAFVVLGGFDARVHDVGRAVVLLE